MVLLALPQNLDRLLTDIVVNIEKTDFAQSAQQDQTKQKSLVVRSVKCSDQDAARDRANGEQKRYRCMQRQLLGVDLDMRAVRFSDQRVNLKDRKGDDEGV